MKIFNKTKNVLVSDDVLMLRTFREKSDGMRAFKEPRPIYFETRLGVHTFDMKFPIDVVVLDEKNRVVVIRKNMKPNRFFFWNPKYRRVLEFSTGSLIEKYDQLEIS